MTVIQPDPASARYAAAIVDALVKAGLVRRDASTDAMRVVIREIEVQRAMSVT